MCVVREKVIKLVEKFVQEDKKLLRKLAKEHKYLKK